MLRVYRLIKRFNLILFIINIDALKLMYYYLNIAWIVGGEIIMFDKVRDIISEQLGIDADEITLESSFMDDLGADSLDIVELIMALESEFDLEIPDEDAEKINAVGDVVEYIKSHTEE